MLLGVSGEQACNKMDSHFNLAAGACTSTRIAFRLKWRPFVESAVLMSELTSKVQMSGEEVIVWPGI